MADEFINIKICMGSSCFARGNAQNLQFLEDFIKQNKINAEIELMGSRCENKCSEGPNIIINETLYSGISTDELARILSRDYVSI